jgi:hypothetical protein
MPTSLPFIGSGAGNASAMNPQTPLAIEVAVTPSSDGGYQVGWNVVLLPIEGVSTSVQQLAGGSMKMQPTDLYAKLLYAVRGGLLEALKKLTMQQIVPIASSLPAGNSFYWSIAPDVIAALPSNPQNVGL